MNPGPSRYVPRARRRPDQPSAQSRKRSVMGASVVKAARILDPALAIMNGPTGRRACSLTRLSNTYPNPSSLAMSIRCTSEVPSPISRTFASR